MDTSRCTSATRGTNCLSIRHTEGACSFFALFDHTIDLPVGSVLALDAAPHDIEALDDSAFVLDVRTELTR